MLKGRWEDQGGAQSGEHDLGEEGQGAAGIVQLRQCVNEAKGGHGAGHGGEGTLQHAALGWWRQVAAEQSVWPDALTIEGVGAVRILHYMTPCRFTADDWNNTGRSAQKKGLTAEV